MKEQKVIGQETIDIYDDVNETVYKAMKKLFAHLGLDKNVDDKTFKAICAKYKGYIIGEADAWNESVDVKVS